MEQQAKVRSLGKFLAGMWLVALLGSLVAGGFTMYQFSSDDPETDRNMLRVYYSVVSLPVSIFFAFMCSWAGVSRTSSALVGLSAVLPMPHLGFVVYALSNWK